MKEHWDKVYAAGRVNQLGWYEAEPKPSLQMIARCSLGKKEPILDVGAGATTLIDYLLEQEYQRVIALDISEMAIEALRSRLGPEKAARVQWIVDDLTAPTEILELDAIRLWHDRAVLHFLIEERDQQTYVSTLRKVLRAGGYAIIATFAKHGATKCSGLEVKRYDHDGLARLLGDEFELQDRVDYLYRMPSGDTRPYLYTLFRKRT